MSAEPQQGSQSRQRSQSRNRESKRQSRPTTPLRPSSRESFRRSLQGSSGPDTLGALLPHVQELDDAMQTLHENFYQLQQLHESINKFNENFSSLLYGLNMNAFCVEFAERPVPESFKRAAKEEEEIPTPRGRSNSGPGTGYRNDYDAETTFMTNDTFVEPPAPVQSAASSAADKSKAGGGKAPRIPVRGTKSSRARRASGIARGRYTTR